MAEKISILSRYNGLNKCPGDVFVMDVFSVYLFKKDTNGCLAIIIIDRAFREYDSLYNPSLDTGRGLFSDLIISDSEKNA
jgi:hypothetical protein